MNFKILLPALFCCCTAQPFYANKLASDARPAARWWWLGSAVDARNLTLNLEEYASKGMGSLEITPIYGVQGNDAAEVSYLSAQWMELLRHTLAEGKRLGIQIDMNTGTGWPFGGPEVAIEDAASKLVVETYQVPGKTTWKQQLAVSDPKQQGVAKLEAVVARNEQGKTIVLTNRVQSDNRIEWKAPAGNWQVIALFCGKTFQKVKRAAPGGEGYVMNHFSKESVGRYLNRFEKAFGDHGVAYPHNFFNDSYEVYGADWTPGFLTEFKNRRGYALEYYLPEFLGDRKNEATARLIADYRETLGELLLENFTNQWSGWAESHGSQTRNQAHGSPGNLIDLYASVSVPECESFGISDYGITGLRVDSLKKENDSDLTMLKYASSAAHITGKPLVSSETFTWLTEHFRTSLAQCKPDLDLMFLAGVNHTFFHGTPYSPMDAEWPGWLFYASVNMSPSNSIWRDAAPFFDYITRCQTFLQQGAPDSDFLVYLPVYDMWHEQDGRLLMFDIHKMKQRAPEFIETVQSIIEAGYDVDYISDQFIRQTSVDQGRIRTAGADYAALIVPAADKMPVEVLRKLNEMAQQGANIVFLKQYPTDVPGFANLDKRRKEFGKELQCLPANDFNKTVAAKAGAGKVVSGTDIDAVLALCGGKQEVMKNRFGLQTIRRKTDYGYGYFISALKSADTFEWVPLGVSCTAVELVDPLTGKSGKARTRRKDDVTEVFLDLKSGESCLLKAYAATQPQSADWQYRRPNAPALEIDRGWNLSFIESAPAIAGSFAIDTLGSWTSLAMDEARVNMGTGVYETTFELPAGISQNWILSLGDVRESARVFVNGQDAGTAWSVPYELEVGSLVRPGINTLRIEVTNLPANRIADYDRREIPWRKFKEINMVDLNYKKTTYAHWQPVLSGLCGPVRLIPLKEQKAIAF